MPDLSGFGKLLLILGIGITVVGLLFMLGDKFPGWDVFPGISVTGERTSRFISPWGPVFSSALF